MVVVLLGLACAVLALVLGRTYDAQLQQVAQARLNADLPVVKAGLLEARVRDLRLVQVAAADPELARATANRNVPALARVLGPLRANMSPFGTILAVVAPNGRTLAADPFTQINFAPDGPVRQASQGRADANASASPNAVFLTRSFYPVLSVEAAWPVRIGGKVAGSLVLVNVISDSALSLNGGATGLQAGIVATRQGALLAGSPTFRQLQQRRQLGSLLAAASQPTSQFPAELGGQRYFLLATPFPSQPVATQLILGVSGNELAVAASSLRRQLAIVAAVAFVVLAILGCAGLALWLQPLRALREGAHAVRKGERLSPLKAGAPPELRELSSALSDTAAELAAALSLQRGGLARVEAITDSMLEGVVLSDVDRRVTLVNPVARRLLGINGVDPAGAIAPGLLSLDSSEASPIELAESKVIQSRSSPILSEDGHTAGYVTLLRDASEEAKLDRLKSEFVGVVSHELRTPLTSIKGSVDILLEDETGDLNTTQRRFLSTIRRSSDRLINLVNDLLDLSSLEAGRVQIDPHPVDVRHLVEDTARSLSNLFVLKRQEVTVTAAVNLPPVLADRQRLEQVLVNLLGNASKYTPEQGQVSVSARSEGGWVFVDVSDSGPGLSAEDLGRVFERFFRAGDSLTQQQAGSGLGLAIARSLVELHGGRLTASSEPGRGSTFTIGLPAYEEEE